MPKQRIAGAVVGFVVLLLLALPLRTTTLTWSSSAPLFSEPPEETKAVLVFGGDMMFDRYIRQVMEVVGGEYVFSCIAPVLLGSDGVVANLEGPITNFPSVSRGTKDGEDGHYAFTFAPEVAALLKQHNVLAVNLGNNHIRNFGEVGIRETRKYLEDAGVLYFGDTGSADDVRVLQTSVNDIPFSFINYNEFAPASAGSIYGTEELVKAERAAGRIVVVYTHWGDEYAPAPERVKALAREFVDAGAHLVVGSHPHVVQESERYQGGHIYYSLGNFVFDQYFSDEVRNGLLIEVTFDGDGVETIKEIFTVLHTDGRTCLRDPD